MLGCAAAVRSTGPTTARPDLIAGARRNWTFAGSDMGGHRAAVLYALIETFKLNGVDPQACLADVLVRLPDHPNRSIDGLRPWNWTQHQPQQIAA